MVLISQFFKKNIKYFLIVPMIKAFIAVELKNYNAILAPLIYQKCLAAVEVKL